MLTPAASPLTEPWDMGMAGFKTVDLVLAPGTASGYKRVKKVNAKAALV